MTKNKLSIISFAIGLSLVFLFWLPFFGIILAALAVILGFVSLTQIKKSSEEGKGFAITGIVLGSIAVLINLIFFGGLFLFLTYFSDSPFTDKIPEIPVLNEGKNEDTLAEVNPQKESVAETSPQSNPQTTPRTGYVSEDIYNEDVVFVKSKRTFIPEVSFLLATLRILEDNNWEGDDSDLGISIEDYQESYIQKLIDENNYQEDLFIPEEIEEIYLSEEAESEIYSMISKARKEYIDYLRSREVNEKYIQEIETNAFPDEEERITYHAVNEWDVPPTAIEAMRDEERNVINGDYSRLELNMYAIDLYNGAKKLKKSGILGPEPSVNDGDFLAYHKRLRDLSLRYYMYHEMTHVLQRAYDTVHAPEEDKKTKLAWSKGDKKIMDADTKYHIEWGRSYATDSNNRVVSQESQAEGAAFEVIVHTYKMTETQETVFWDYMFDYLEDARKEYDEAMAIFNEKFPEILIDNFGSVLLYDFIDDLPVGQEPRSTLAKLSIKMVGLPAYGGYFHPMRAEDMPKLWEYLKE